MWHKAEWIGRPMRLELIRVGLLVYLANRYTTGGALKKQPIYKVEVFVAKNIEWDIHRHKIWK